MDEALDQFIRRLQSVVKVYREDDILRFLVQPIGKIEPYAARAISGPSSGGYHGLVRSETLSLSYGPESRTDHVDGATAELPDGLAGCSSDIPLLPAASTGAVKCVRWCR